MRLFIAVHLSEEIKQAIAKTIVSLQTAKADVSWVPEENLHITLKFLGDADKSRIKGIVPLLTELASSTSKYTISAGNPGAFPDMDKPRIIGTGIKEGKNNTIELCKKMDETLLRAAFKREEKPFNPHITIGRVRGAINLDKLTQALNTTLLPPVEQVIDSFYLMKSELLPGGAEYKDVQEFKLNKSL